MCDFFSYDKTRNIKLIVFLSFIGKKKPISRALKRKINTEKKVKKDER